MVQSNKNKSTQVKKAAGANTKFNKDDVIFALDIGTRTVVGVAGVEEDKKFKVLAAEVVEHKNRAMLNGQIHDISLVANAVTEIKERLETKLGFKLDKVAIAAAGRVLKTYSANIDKDMDPNSEITREVISSLELEGIQLAQSRLESEQDGSDKSVFYCVGYSVISYYINGYVISTLLGHKAGNIGVEVLATFLPHVVIDSLYTVMNRVGLEVVNLTLEPIAAINVCIPPDLRLLNLALVDIGAGTSDIAITKDGAVIAYAMVPKAGDEITEKIVHHYLVDFSTAEKIKVSLNNTAEDTVAFTDVLKMKRIVQKEEILGVIRESVEKLGETIADKILEYNQKAPNAVFCVGGGSQIEGLTEVIADKLGLPADRVVVRGRDIIQSVKFSGKKLAGPEAITPMGIAVNSMIYKDYDFLSVTLNGKKIRLFNSKKLNVADALILVGYDPSKLIGRSGKSLTFELNGERRTAKGEFGRAAVITVNGQQASMETPLKPGDSIDIVPAEDGRPAALTVGEIIDLSEKKITYNKIIIDITPKVTVNGDIVEAERPISNGDKVNFTAITTAADFARSIDFDINQYKVVVNGEEVSGDYILKGGEELELIEDSTYTHGPDLEDLYDSDESEYFEPFLDGCNQRNIKGQEIVLDGSGFDTARNADEDSSSISVSVNGKDVVINGNKNEYMFIDVFSSIDFDMTEVKGSVALKLNGKRAAFTDQITNGDVIEITWDNN